MYSLIVNLGILEVIYRFQTIQKQLGNVEKAKQLYKPSKNCPIDFKLGMVIPDTAMYNLILTKIDIFTFDINL